MAPQYFLIWENRLVSDNNWVLMCEDLKFDYEFKIALQKIDKQILSPPERPEGKHQDGSYGERVKGVAKTLIFPL